MEIVEAAASAADLSLFTLFFQADWVVKSVMLGLLVASIGCWAIIFSKLGAYGRARREMKAFENAFAAGETLDAMYQRLGKGPKRGMPALFVAAMEEWTGSPAQNAANREGLQTRLQIVLDSAIAEESEKIESRLSFLATVGSAAPFVGLFGTVWGIMNSFQSIAASKSTNLAVVAPGIAEALFATALGLLAAIPAVVAYNKLSGDSGRLIGRLEGFADRVAVLLSRQLDAKSLR